MFGAEPVAPPAGVAPLAARAAAADDLAAAQDLPSPQPSPLELALRLKDLPSPGQHCLLHPLKQLLRAEAEAQQVDAAGGLDAVCGADSEDRADAQPLLCGQGKGIGGGAPACCPPLRLLERVGGLAQAHNGAVRAEESGDLLCQEGGDRAAAI